MSLPASGPKRIATGGLERGEIELVDNPTVGNVRAGKRRDGWPLVSGTRSSRDGGAQGPRRVAWSPRAIDVYTSSTCALRWRRPGEVHRRQTCLGEALLVVSICCRLHMLRGTPDTLKTTMCSSRVAEAGYTPCSACDSATKLLQLCYFLLAFWLHMWIASTHFQSVCVFL
jgi:hypothetical protein